MFPSFIITVRESVEAAFIIGALTGMLAKAGKADLIKAVWRGLITASIVSVVIFMVGLFSGHKISTLITSANEPLYEGTVQIFSGIFIIWTVFFLHKNFILSKGSVMAGAREMATRESYTGIFLLAFVNVLREGLEIVLFLSSSLLTGDRVGILGGFLLGLFFSIGIALMLYKTEIKLPVRVGFRLTSIFLVISSILLITGGIGEIAEFTGKSGI